jgi:hypothetical protein
MAMLLPGFTPGFRGRKQASTLGRRAYYLASQNGRESALLLGMEGQALTPEQAIEAMGGPQADYHEVIVAPSEAECRTIERRIPGDPQRAREEAGIRVARAHANGRPYLLAIHEQDGRFHFHIAVRGSMPGQVLGRNGMLQKLWDREIFGDEPRIQDWEAHQRFRESRTRLKQVIREQRENEVQRREAVKRALPGQKAEVARPYEVRSRELIERRYGLEQATLLARYEARGTVGSPRYQAELEPVEHRHTGALRRLEKRELGREMHSARVRASQSVESVGRGVQRGARVGGALAQRAADEGLRAMGVPEPVRAAVGVAFAITQEATQAALRVGMEMSKTAARAGLELAQAPAHAVTAPVSLVHSAGSGVVGLTRSVLNRAGAVAPLPKPVQAAFQVAGWVPVAGIAAKAIQLAAEVTQAAMPAEARGPERD